MHRLLVDTAQLESDSPALAKAAVNHLKVLRPKDGEEIELFDGKGKWRVFSYSAMARRLVAADSHLHYQPLLRQLTLFACVTKGSRWDWTIEKATELGATRIVPVVSDRTIVRIAANDCAAKRERWRRIAEDAARQSDAKWLPDILMPITFAESLTLVKATRCFVGALSSPPPPTIGEALARLSEDHSHLSLADRSLPLSVFVGPEGDFTPEELAALIAIATPVSFGSTILRAETAAIYGVSILKAYLDSIKEQKL